MTRRHAVLLASALVLGLVVLERRPASVGALEPVAQPELGYSEAA